MADRTRYIAHYCADLVFCPLAAFCKAPFQIRDHAFKRRTESLTSAAGCDTVQKQRFFLCAIQEQIQLLFRQFFYRNIQRNMMFL